MPNSNGEESEKSPPNQGDSKKAAQNKRKRNRNRKKNAAKVENLVSKTFQAKLVANSSLTENTTENQVPSKIKVAPVTHTKPNQSEQEASPSSNPVEPLKKTSPNKSHGKRHPKPSPMGDTSPPKDNNEPNIAPPKTVSTMVQSPAIPGTTSAEKSREEIKAEREAKKLAKQQAKKKNKDGNVNPSQENLPASPLPSENNALKKAQTKHLSNGETPIHNSQEGSNKKQAKQEAKGTISLEVNTTTVTEKLANITVSDTPNDVAAKIKDVNKKPVLTKAERRAIQEAQRAAKADGGVKNTTKVLANLLVNEKKTVTVTKEVAGIRTEKVAPIKSTKDCKVKLFNHLESCRKDSNLFVNNQHIHPIIVKLGEQYAKRTIVGSNARCISFLSALKTVIQDYETPAKKEFARSLETTIKDSIDHLHKCRPLAVSVSNAYKHIKHVLTQLSVDQPESELKEHLCHFIDTYIENQIGKAAEAISISVQDKISNGDVILTFGCSSLINYIFEEAHRRHVDFQVIVVDSRPFSEGQELLRRLTAKEIPCTYVLINAVGFVMPEVTKILLGAHALLSNGYVMARTGTAQVALVARSFNVPVLVCCETHKFSERFQTDAIVYNELGNPDDLVMSDKCRLMNWQSQNKLSPLNLNYDITPPELVTAVVTEVAILPCTSVPVILRIKPTEIGY